MPLYVYRCNKCFKELELLERINIATKPFPCDCGGIMNRQITRSFVFSVVGGTPKHSSKDNDLAETDTLIDELEVQQRKGRAKAKNKDL